MFEGCLEDLVYKRIGGIENFGVKKAGLSMGLRRSMERRTCQVFCVTKKFGSRLQPNRAHGCDETDDVTWNAGYEKNENVPGDEENNWRRWWIERNKCAMGGSGVVSIADE